MTPDQILQTLVALLSGTGEPAFEALRDGGHDDRYPVVIESCPRPLGPLEVEGQTVICGRVSVPEDHNAEGGETIPLAFAILKSRSAAPAPDPVIYLHGGPGGYTVQSIPDNAAIFDFLRNRRDLVIFDQRASGISDRTIACYNAFAEDFMGFARPDEETMFDADQPLAHCITEMVDSGIDLSLYNTTQSALDVRAIMHALGYPTYNAFGISYGTKLGQELLRAAPEGLRSLVIDSISLIDQPAYDTNGVPPDQALGWIVDFCAEDEACAAAYPDLESTVHEAADYLAQTGVTVAGTEFGPELIEALLSQSNKTGGPFTAYMPQVLTEIAAGETTTLTRLLTGGFVPDVSVAGLMARFGGDLSEPDRTIAEVLFMQAEQMRSLQGSASSLLNTLSDDLSSAAADTEQLLDSALSEVALGMEAPAQLAMVQSYTSLIGQEPDKADIVAFVTENFPATELPRLLALVEAMSEDDVAAFYTRAVIDAARLTSAARMSLTLGIIACQEDFPFNSAEGFDAVSADYRFPVIDAGVRPDTYPLYGFCELFEQHPRDGYHDAVQSDLPVLAMAGTKDTQTNPDAAERVVSTLPNGQAVLFPEAGHGVIMFSPCARDIAVGFLEDPQAEVSTVCTEALKPKFYIPPAPAE
ncbi:alpha/beta hydrolase [Psychromarinibacter sp. S121]|uniref:alpha/beta hydrolase n=1 Tax=Psychromarinibacter sp. S121 TaxID=3415127 RepID=UPI003C7D006A